MVGAPAPGRKSPLPPARAASRPVLVLQPRATAVDVPIGPLQYLFT